MRNLSLFIKRIKRWTPERRSKEKTTIQEKKRKLETRRRDIQAQIDAIAIELDALYTIDSTNIPEVHDYKSKVHVSDHAVVRYIDRVLELDPELFRKEFIKMMPESIPRNASTVTIDNMVFQLVWLPNQIVVKTFYKRRKSKKRQP